MLKPLLIVCALLSAPVWAEAFPAKVVVVLDGDTVMVVTNGRGGRPFKVRLADIDAPEKDQPWGGESSQALAGKVLHQEVGVETRARDKYGRVVAHLTMGRRDICAEMVAEGNAWVYSFRHVERNLVSRQTAAREARRGLWGAAHPVPPWGWRKTHRAERGAVQAGGDFVCGRKHRCGQMRSCDEAHYFLTHCRVRGLDADGDGVPCPELCR